MEFFLGNNSGEHDIFTEGLALEYSLLEEAAPDNGPFFLDRFSRCTHLDDALINFDGTVIGYLHGSCHPGGFEFYKDIPACKLVEHGCLYAPVQDPEVPLIVLSRFPSAHDLVTVLEEVHLETEGIGRGASETVVAGQAGVGILERFHIRIL